MVSVLVRFFLGCTGTSGEDWDAPDGWLRSGSSSVSAISACESDESCPPSDAFPRGWRDIAPPDEPLGEEGRWDVVGAFVGAAGLLECAAGAAEGEGDACSVGALRCAADGVCSRAVFCREGGRAVGERLVGVGLWERDLDIQILSIKPGKQSRIVATSDGGQVTGREEGNGGDECRAGTLKVIKCGRDANDLSL